MREIATATAGDELAEPCRLAISLELAASREGWMGFAALGQRAGLSDGNLHCHLRRLLAAALVEVRGNGARGRASKTEFRLTDKGRSHLAARAATHLAIARSIEDALLAQTAAEPAIPAPVMIAPSVMVAAAVAVPVAARAAAIELVEERYSGPD